MDKVAQYQNNAEECRKLAGIARNAEERASLLLMAATWDTIANERLLHREKEREALENREHS